MTAAAPSPARQRLSWVVAGFAQAVPTADAIAEVFTPAFLDAVPPERIASVFAAAAAPDLVVESVEDHSAWSLTARTSAATVLDLDVEIAAPHRIAGLLLRPAEPEAVDDERLADPPMIVTGASPELHTALVSRFASSGAVGDYHADRT